MPAPTIAALLDYETHIEDALAAVLATALTNAVQVLTPRTPITTATKKLTPRVQLELAVTGTGEHSNTRPGSHEYDDWKTGSLTITCAIRRDASGQSLGTLRGGVRAALLKGAGALTGSNLPYYEIPWLQESGSTPEIEQENDEITCTITYDLQWSIKPDQFPAV